MPRTGRPKAELTLTDADRAQLQRWARRAKSSQALALRARIVLACAEPGVSNKQVAADLHCSQPTVGKWRAPVLRGGLDGLTAEDRPRPPPSGSPDQGEEGIVATLGAQPAHATHWARRAVGLQC